MGEMGESSIYRQILEATKDMRDAVHSLEERDRAYGERMKRIETLLAGNGTKGLCQRLEDVEKLKEKVWRLLGIAAGIGVIVAFVGQSIGKPLIQAIVKALAG